MSAAPSTTRKPSRSSWRATVHRRLAACAVLGTFAGLLTGSCTGVLDLEGYRDAVPALCTLLERCYGRTGIPGCLNHVETRLEGASEEARAEWLRLFTAFKCLDGCLNAWECLDIAPICQPPGEPCALAEQCCGFTSGFGACSRQACCAPNGVPCASNEDCCGSQCTDGSCGGVACKLQDAPCVNSFECCSLICHPLTSTCSENICSPDGFPCMTSDECCSFFCDSDNTCAVPPCAKEGDPCSDNSQCCQDLGLECSLQGLCAPPGGCQPYDADCMIDTDCCSMYCDPIYAKCGDQTVCFPIGASCTLPEECCSGLCGNTLTCECVPDGTASPLDGQCCNDNWNGVTCGSSCQDVGAACTGEFDCCSGLCPKGTCCFPAGCDHDVCSEGAPLDSAKCANMPVEDGGVPVDTVCIDKVCAADPNCCCNKWDITCVTLVAQECGPICPGGPPMP